MTTCREIIRQGMLEIKALASGEQPTADELADCLPVVQAILDGLFGFGVGGQLADQEITADTTLVPGVRALVLASATITFPVAPDNGARLQVRDLSGSGASLDGNNRLIDGAATASLTPNASKSFVYIADDANWISLVPLTADSDLPINEDEFFRLETAKRIVPMFGGGMSQESADALVRAGNRIRAKYRSTAVVPCDDAVTFLSRQSYRTGFYGL